MAATLTVQQEKQRRSVHYLQELYTVVVAIALALTVDRLIPEAGEDLEFKPFLLAGAFLVTVIPYYHGALRHLDEQYAGENAPAPSRAFAVLVDFLLLFLESCIFLALAVSIGQPVLFAWLLVALLLLDVAWISLTTTVLARGGEFDALRAWRIINIVAAAALVLYLLTAGDGAALWYAILVFALARTVADYSVTWWFYTAAPRRD